MYFFVCEIMISLNYDCEFKMRVARPYAASLLPSSAARQHYSCQARFVQRQWHSRNRSEEKIAVWACDLVGKQK